MGLRARRESVAQEARGFDDVSVDGTGHAAAKGRRTSLPTVTPAREPLSIWMVPAVASAIVLLVFLAGFRGGEETSRA